MTEIRDQARIARIGLKATRIATSAATVGANAARESADTAARAAALAERALLLTERADVLVDAVPISTYPVFDADSVIKVVYKNFGRTRANRAQATTRLIPVGVNLVEPDAPSEIFAAIIGAGDTLPISFYPMRSWLNAETFIKIRDGEIARRFTTEIFYFDIFDKGHHTKCSGVFMPGTCSFRIDDDQEAD